MRFTLQHILLVVFVVATLYVLNMALGGTLPPFQSVFILAVVVLGAGVGLRRFHKRNPCAVVAPLSPAFSGIMLMVVMSGLLGWFLGCERHEICVKTFQARTVCNYGILGWSTTGETPESRVIEQELNYRPLDHEWVRTVSYDFGTISDYFPWFRYPVLDLDAADLRLLKHLRDRAKVASLLEATYPLNVEARKAREIAMNELKWRFGRQNGIRRAGSNEQIAMNWWNDFEPVLRPLPDPAALRQAILDYRVLVPSPDAEAGMKAYVGQELAPLAGRVGL